MSVQAIDRIQPLWTDLQTEGMRLDAGAEVGGTRRTQPTLFSDIFQSAIDRVRETDAAKNEVAYQLATGQLDNPAALASYLFSLSRMKVLSSPGVISTTASWTPSKQRTTAAMRSWSS